MNNSGMSPVPAARGPAASILIISDLKTESAAITRVLEAADHHVLMVPSITAATFEGAQREFAVIVCALTVIDPASLHALHAFRSNSVNVNTPLVLLAPRGTDQAAALRVLGAGIIDFIDQPVDDLILRSKVKMLVELYRAKQQIKDMELRGNVPLTDALTALPTRVLFMDRADQAMRQAARSGGRVALGVMDLDQVQEVSETLGPATGEELLRQIALRLTGALRRSDTVARVGATAFATVLACDTRDGVQTVTERLNRVMADPFVVGAHRITLGGGIGVALFPEHGREPQLLLERANAAMVIAKQNSMGHLFFDPIQHTESDDNAETAEMNAEELLKVSAA